MVDTVKHSQKGSFREERYTIMVLLFPTSHYEQGIFSSAVTSQQYIKISYSLFIFINPSFNASVANF